MAFALMPADGASAAYTFKTLHSFCSRTNCLDGNNPEARLVMDQAQNLYGTTEGGGRNDAGVVFKLVPNADKSAYKASVLHSFCSRTNCTDGAVPTSDLIMDVDGNLYGTTYHGGSTNAEFAGDGIVFKLTHGSRGWTLTVLKNFCSDQSCNDGLNPTAGLSYAGQDSGQAWDEFSPLFGTTDYGGTYGNGVAYQLTSDGSLWNYTVIHNFESSNTPNALLVDNSGNVYGTTQGGGKYGGGLMYKLASGTWTETALHYFCSTPPCAGGGGPVGRLFMDSSGNLFGTATDGGSGSSCTEYVGCGVVFERSSGGSYSVLYNFCSQTNCADGSFPDAGVIMDGAGHLFGTTYDGGASGYGGIRGTVYELSGGTESVLYSFCSQQSCTDGEGPLNGALILDPSGNLLGTTWLGGAHGGGTVFRLTP
jgi:uncharacterized repeat protein (TIGR03803 family)